MFRQDVPLHHPTFDTQIKYAGGMGVLSSVGWTARFLFLSLPRVDVNIFSLWGDSVI